MITESERERMEKETDARADAAYDTPLSEMTKGEFVMALAMAAVVISGGDGGNERDVVQAAERLALEFFRRV